VQDRTQSVAGGPLSQLKSYLADCIRPVLVPITICGSSDFIFN